MIYAPRPLRLPDLYRRSRTGTPTHVSPGYSPVYSPVNGVFEPAFRHHIGDRRTDFVRSPSIFSSIRPQVPRSGSDPQLTRWENEMDDYNDMLRLRTRDPRELRGGLHRQCNWNIDQPSPRKIDSYHPVINKNTVDLERIAEGLDTRTTVSIKSDSCIKFLY